jgi:hypothetical protein
MARCGHGTICCLTLGSRCYSSIDRHSAGWSQQFTKPSYPCTVVVLLYTTSAVPHLPVGLVARSIHCIGLETEESYRDRIDGLITSPNPRHDPAVGDVHSTPVTLWAAIDILREEEETPYRLRFACIHQVTWRIGTTSISIYGRGVHTLSPSLKLAIGIVARPWRRVGSRRRPGTRPSLGAEGSLTVTVTDDRCLAERLHEPPQHHPERLSHAFPRWQQEQLWMISACLRHVTGAGRSVRMHGSG